MTLTTRIYTNSVRIDYSYNARSGVHGVYFMGGGGVNRKGGVRGTAVLVVDALQDFRDNSEVRELIEWLSR